MISYRNLHFVCMYFAIQGVIIIFPCLDTWHRVDMRTVSFDVPPQEVRVCIVSHDLVM